jgi:DNA-directed RNA polymerase subunit RPC12/RpoP
MVASMTENREYRCEVCGKEISEEDYRHNLNGTRNSYET